MFPCPLIIVVTFGVKCKFAANRLSTLGKKFFSNSSFCRFLPLTLSFSYTYFLIRTFFPGLLFYRAFWYSAVCYVVVLSCLLRKSICGFFSIYPGVSFHPLRGLLF